MQDGVVSTRTVVAVFGGIAVLLATVIAVVAFVTGHESARSHLSVAPASHVTRQYHSTATTTPPPTAAITTADPEVDQQAAAQTAITQAQATVATDQAAVQQDATSIQSLTAQQQALQGAITQQRQQEQAQEQLANTGDAAGANLAALVQQYQAADQAQDSQMASIVSALNTDEANSQQDEANLAAAVLALQIAQDLAAAQA